MSFKVGDRVEVIKPAQGVKASENNKVGVGQVLEKDRNAYRVRVEGNQNDWWYPVEDLRPLTTPNEPAYSG